MPEPRVVSRHSGIRYSFCTLVSDKAEYGRFVASFKAGGFDADCEYLYVDNTAGNTADAYEGARLMFNEAVGDYIVYCHQDVLLLEHGRADLDRVLAELTAAAPDWGIAGNAGTTGEGVTYSCIVDPASDREHGPFPMRVATLDENFMVTRREARLSTSGDLTGFHLYGTDLCLMADVLGHSCWVIPFKLRHLSTGRLRETYLDHATRLQDKYQRAFRDRYIDTVIGFKALITGSPEKLALSRLIRPKGKHVWRHMKARLGKQETQS